MILSKIVRAQLIFMRGSPSQTNLSFFSKNTPSYWFRSDPPHKNSKPMFKKQPVEAKLTQSTESVQKPKSRLFKRLNNNESNPVQKQPFSQSQSSTPHPNQAPSQYSHHLSTHNLHSCQLLLNNFKDITKQSKSVPDIINNFLKYKTKLKDFSIKETALKDKYKPIMYASMMRAFSRILRREVFLERAHFIRFLGNEYEQLEKLDISCLNTLQLSDFIEFFNLFEISMKFNTFSEGKIRVIDKYLKEIHNRYIEQQSLVDSSTSSHQDAYAQSRQHSIVDKQKLAKRRLSQLIMVSRTAQIFNSPYYEKFLDLLINNLSNQDLNSYKITSLLRFILRPQCISHIHKQAQILDMILAKMNSSQIFKDFTFFNIKELYVNLCSIVDNNQYVLDMTQTKQMIIKIEDQILTVLPQLQSDEIYQLAFYSLRRDDIAKRDLARKLLTLTLSQIQPNGQTSLNPLFIIEMFSVNSAQEIKFTQIDPLWQKKFLNMFNRYLINTQSHPNLRFCSQYIENIYYKTQSEKIKQAIINSFLCPQKKLIIPYNNESYMLQTHFLLQSDMSKKLASLYRLAKVRARMQKSRGYLEKVFETLESQFDKETKAKILEENSEYINSVEQSRMNRHGYMKILSRYCQQLKHQELINQIFFQSLVYMIETRAEYIRNATWFPKISFDTYKDFSQFDLSQILDQKCRDKVCALFHTFVIVLLELNLKMTTVQSSKSIWEKIQSSKFLKLVKKHDIIGEIFIEVFCRKQIGNAILNNNANPERTQFLIKLLRYFSLGPQTITVNKSCIQTSPQQQDYEKYYFAYYQILKIYPMESLKTILSIEEAKQAVEKVLGSKKKIKKSIESKSSQTTEAKRSHFIYEKETGEVTIDPQHTKILKLRVKKSLTNKKADKKSKRK